jgi:hypothetical protein
MDAEGVDCLEAVGLAGPAGTDADGLVKSSADDSTEVEPPAVAAQKLAHESILNTNYDLLFTVKYFRL